MGLEGLSRINIELNSTCFKQTHCSWCGHQKHSVHPHRMPGEMDMQLLRRLSEDIPSGVVVQFHRDGDPIDCSDLGKKLRLFDGRFRNLVTHGEKLAEKADELIDNCESICVSMFANDKDIELQALNIRKFIERRGDQKPIIMIKWVGHHHDGLSHEFDRLGIPQTFRQLHLPSKNERYKTKPLMPEIGVCLDALHHPSVAWTGKVYLCNRLDPNDDLCIGDLNTDSLSDIWGGQKRMAMVAYHEAGQRKHANPLCASCQFWGIPTV